MLKRLMEFARIIRLVSPEDLPENEIRKDAYEAGYESDAWAKNPHRPGSIIYRSWAQGKRERERYEQTLW